MTRGAGRAERSRPLLPEPKRRTRRAGAFRITGDTPLLLPASETGRDPRLLHAARTAQRALAATAGAAPPIALATPADARTPAIRLGLDPRAAPAPRRETARDAYRLRVGRRGITLDAPSLHGLRHGLQTLAQLVDGRGDVPCGEILDQPDFRDRGIMLDVSRGKVPTRATLEGLVDLCARLRLNVLMLYVEHTFAFRAHPEIGEGSSPLDAETVLALDAYAETRGVELVPCLQSLGHMERVLSLERYAALAESDRRWSVSPARPETYDLLGELYDEFLPLFRSGRFNANCDEPFDLGRGQSAKRAPGRSPGRLFADHVSRLEGLAGRHDKRLMVWADFALKHPDQLDRIGRDVVLLDWWYEPEFDFDRIRRLRRRGFEVQVCPGTASWNALFPRVETSRRNIERWADAGRRHGASGLLNTDWGDFGHYNALGASFYGYAWGAQQAWSGTPSGDDPAARFDVAFARTVFGERSGALGQLYRRLGAIHDAGFPIANGSGLQYVYFDPLDRCFFLQHATAKALRASGRKLDAVLRAVDRLDLAEAPGGDAFLVLARQEIAWAAAATRLAIDKGLAALDYVDWRDDPSTLDAKARRALAGRFEALAARQRDQLDALVRLWRARSEVAELETTRRRLRRAITSLRTAAKRLRENRPPRPVRRAPLTMLGVFNEMRRATGRPPRPSSSPDA